MKPAGFALMFTACVIPPTTATVAVLQFGMLTAAVFLYTNPTKNRSKQ